MIHIYTDGSCLGNPGPGGWAAVVEDDGRKRALAGREDDTTNNRMEILAAIKGLEAVPDGGEVTLFSDSQYLVNTMTRGWKRNANQDLWALLDTVAGKRHIHWEWVRGHTGNPGNEEANALANAQIGLPPESTGRAPSRTGGHQADEGEQKTAIFVGTAWDSAAKKGAWSVFVSGGPQPDTTSGNVMDKTNPSRLDLTAAVKGLRLAGSSRWVQIHTYSDYLINCGSGVWERRANKDLWSEIDELGQGKRLAWIEDKGVQVAKAHDYAVGLLAGKTSPTDVSESPTATPSEQKEEPFLSHLDAQGRARMVDVGDKEPTTRVAVAKGTVRMKPETLRLIQQGQMEKGDVLAVARIAGIMGAKKTSELIPLCHPIPIDQVTVELEPDETESTIHITATARTTAKTGVEMEALTAVSVAALTIYDMAKAVDRGMRIEAIRLVSKRGGKSGDVVLEQ